VECRVFTVRSYFVKDGRTLVLFGADDVYAVGVSAIWSKVALAISDEVLVAGIPGKRQLVGIDGPSTFLTIRPPRTAWSRRQWLAAAAKSTPLSTLPPRVEGIDGEVG
jgi:hypothetical protein